MGLIATQSRLDLTEIISGRFLISATYANSSMHELGHFTVGGYPNPRQNPADKRLRMKLWVCHEKNVLLSEQFNQLKGEFRPEMLDYGQCLYPLRFITYTHSPSISWYICDCPQNGECLCKFAFMLQRNTLHSTSYADPSQGGWTTNQLQHYLTSIHGTRVPAQRRHVYGAVAVGRYVKFYEYEFWRPSTNKMLHIERDHVRVQKALNRILNNHWGFTFGHNFCRVSHAYSCWRR